MSGLDTWATSQPGRCPNCGAHIATQGHVGGCLATGKRLAAAGMARTTAAHPDERAAVDAAIRTLAARGVPFSANSARDLHGVKGGVVGAAFSAAHKAGLIRPVGDDTSTEPGTHGHRIFQWIGVAA